LEKVGRERQVKCQVCLAFDVGIFLNGWQTWILKIVVLFIILYSKRWWNDFVCGKTFLKIL
jgi:hypothetical protein